MLPASLRCSHAMDVSGSTRSEMGTCGTGGIISAEYDRDPSTGGHLHRAGPPRMAQRRGGCSRRTGSMARHPARSTAAQSRPVSRQTKTRRSRPTRPPASSSGAGVGADAGAPGCPAAPPTISDPERMMRVPRPVDAAASRSTASAPTVTARSTRRAGPDDFVRREIEAAAAVAPREAFRQGVGPAGKQERRGLPSGAIMSGRPGAPHVGVTFIDLQRGD